MLAVCMMLCFAVILGIQHLWRTTAALRGGEIAWVGEMFIQQPGKAAGWVGVTVFIRDAQTNARQLLRNGSRAHVGDDLYLIVHTPKAGIVAVLAHTEDGRVLVLAPKEALLGGGQVVSSAGAHAISEPLTLHGPPGQLSLCVLYSESDSSVQAAVEALQRTPWAEGHPRVSDFQTTCTILTLAEPEAQ